MGIRAIETIYNGYRFRSRLEARWAVFFDTAGIRYEYEPQGFDLDKEGYYLPDFWLPRQEIWFEVKGRYPGEGSPECRKAAALAAGSEFPVFMACGSDFGFHGYDRDTFDQLGVRIWEFTPKHLEHGDFEGDFGADWRWCDNLYDLYLGGPCPCGQRTAEGHEPWPEDVSKAYKAARRARFEHGESG